MWFNFHLATVWLSISFLPIVIIRQVHKKFINREIMFFLKLTVLLCCCYLVLLHFLPSFSLGWLTQVCFWLHILCRLTNGERTMELVRSWRTALQIQSWWPFSLMKLLDSTKRTAQVSHIHIRVVRHLKKLEKSKNASF